MGQRTASAGMTRKFARPVVALAGLAVLSWLAAPVQAAPPAKGWPVAEAQTLDLAKKAIAIRSVIGPDNRTADVAALFRDALLAGGWPAADMEITPLGDTAYLIATWRGSDPALGPLVVSGHMDVVEAKREDWQRDPFTPVVEGDVLFGRGASDMKFDAALAVSALIELRRSGYKPRRSIVVAFSGDEETTMRTSQAIAEKLKNADIVINTDGGGGTLDETTGKPRAFSWQGGEKTYADYELTVTNPGGHSSAPRADNAIVRMGRALEKVGTYRFKAEQTPLTKAYFEAAAKLEPDAGLAAAMRAFAANPADEAALAVLRANPSTVGKVGTTCVPTMVNGGHALNALPQRVTANINCRIFPGHSFKAIMDELAGVVADPAVTFRDVTEGSVASPASPLRPDFVKALETAIHGVYPGVPVFPSLSSGASDSMWYRAVGVASYGASPTFSKDSEEFAHGLNERVRLSNIRPGIGYYLSLIPALSR